VKKDEKWADLHIHTVKSDGTFTVEDVFQNAKIAGASAVAITDHDTIDAVDEALYFEKKYQIEFIPGVELSAIHNEREVHIIGLYINWKDNEFLERLTKFQKVRVERAKKIIKKLKDHGIKIKFEELYEITDNMNNAGRLHIARLLSEKNIVKSVKEAFDKFLGEGRPAYVEKERITVKDAINIIKKIGGVAILAHPSHLETDEIILKWKEQGLDGLEAYHPDQPYLISAKYIDFARENKLLISGGSDCHGNQRDYGRIGDIKLPYEYLEDIRDLYKNRLNGQI
jgi:predicted metal-dependent phosphoesterase TrpH